MTDPTCQRCDHTATWFYREVIPIREKPYMKIKLIALCYTHVIPYTAYPALCGVKYSTSKRIYLEGDLSLLKDDRIF